VNPTPLTFWDRAQLLLLRVLSIALGLIDRLFQIDWGERALERMSRRWENQLEELDATLARLEEEREQVQTQSEALAIHAAAIYLAARNLTQDKLRFDPEISHDDEILDATIDLLVKQRLASIETEEIEADHFVYTIDPDWRAILSKLRAASAEADPEIAEWFEEGIRFIDEEFLPQIERSGERGPSNLRQE
jgi:predicted ribosome quality control (RQC) complex YloA/Tae2 family protein